MLLAVTLLYTIRREENKVERYINAASIWMLFCFLTTEVLSVFKAISCLSLWISWLMFDAGLLLGCFRRRRFKLKHLFKIEKKLIWKTFMLGILALGMIGLAIKTIPYNWDSMTYHLPRIFHWLQNGAVDHYATNIGRQVASPVLGAFVHLHVYAMSGGNDIFVNLLQSLSFLSSGILVCAIAERIGCSRKYSLIAGFLFYSMPIAFAESLTTQVDNFACFWMLCFSYLLLGFLNMERKIVLSRETTFRIVILSLSAAFGYLTKPSVGFGILVMLFWLLITVVKRRNKALPLIVYLLLAGFVILCVIMPESLRNLSTYQALASQGTGQRQLIGSCHLKHIAVNFVKNFTYNMPTVWLYNSSDLIWKYVMRFSRLLGIDIDNPAISEDGREFQVRDPQNYGNSTAVNSVLIWLFVICIFLFVFYNIRNNREKVGNQYFAAAGLSFLCFCAVLRWEPFVSRYMISYLAVLCPALAGQLELFFENGKAGKSRAGNSFITILCFLCCTEVLGMLYYHGRIAFEQTEYNGYFVTRREIAESYVELAETLNQGNYRNIGLITGTDSYEYPLTVMLKNYDRIEHVNVENETGKYEELDFIPDILVAINYDGPDYMICHGEEYDRIELYGEEVSILKKRQE